ncbi:hypothetical protein ISN75_06795 [Dyella marensis]|uniref:hypothetical protein n=1 Tax=Dyella marensis TaxID=500610 RepID=UPI0031D7CDFF
MDILIRSNVNGKKREWRFIHSFRQAYGGQLVMWRSLDGKDRKIVSAGEVDAHPNNRWMGFLRWPLYVATNNDGVRCAIPMPATHLIKWNIRQYLGRHRDRRAKERISAILAQRLNN